MFRAYDLVTVALVVPAPALASRIAHTGPTRASLVTAGLLAYLVYTYAYYLFGTGVNAQFLLVPLYAAAALLMWRQARGDTSWRPLR